MNFSLGLLVASTKTERQQCHKVNLDLLVLIIFLHTSY